jgi:hypothetical protein
LEHITGVIRGYKQPMIIVMMMIVMIMLITTITETVRATASTITITITITKTKLTTTTLKCPSKHEVFKIQFDLVLALKIIGSSCIFIRHVAK